MVEIWTFPLDLVGRLAQHSACVLQPLDCIDNTNLTIFEPFHRRLIEIRDGNLAPQKKLSHYFRSILRSFEENQNPIAILGERTKLSLITQDGKSLERYLDQIIIDIISGPKCATLAG